MAYYVPTAHADIFSRLVQITVLIILQAHLLGNPTSCFRHNLHQSYSSDFGNSIMLEIAFIFDNGSNQKRIYIIFLTVGHNILLMIPHINETHLHSIAAPDLPAAEGYDKQHAKKQQPSVQPSVCLSPSAAGFALTLH